MPVLVYVGLFTPVALYALPDLSAQFVSIEPLVGFRPVLNGSAPSNHICNVDTFDGVWRVVACPNGFSAVTCILYFVLVDKLVNVAVWLVRPLSVDAIVLILLRVYIYDDASTPPDHAIVIVLFVISVVERPVIAVGAAVGAAKIILDVTAFAVS